MAEHEAESVHYARWFRASTPYIRKHRGSTFVVTLGGDAIAHTNLVNIIHDLALLSVLGVRIVLVHGARPQIETALSEAGITNMYVGHRRVTTADAMNVIVPTVGAVRGAIEGWFSTGIPNSPLHRTHVRVISGNLVTARPIGVAEGVDLEFTGRVRRIDTDAITGLLDQEAIVLIAPVGYSPSGQAFNLSADELAADVASAIGADKLIILDRAGRLGTSTGELTPSATEQLAGLDPHTALRLAELVRAVRAGVPRAHLVSYEQDGALLEELFTATGSGTQVCEQEFKPIRRATLDDVAGIAELTRPLEADGALVRRPRERLEQDIDHFLVAEVDGVIVGCCAALPTTAPHLVELACLATHADYRRRGDESGDDVAPGEMSLGDRLLGRVETQARDAGAETLFALTTQARDWFIEHGFEDAGSDVLPNDYEYNKQRGSRVVIKRLGRTEEGRAGHG